MPIEDLLKRRSEVRVRLATIPNEIEQVEREVQEYVRVLESHSPTWRRFFNVAIGMNRYSRNEYSTLRATQDRLWLLKDEQRKLEDEQHSLERRIASAKKIKKRYLGAQLAQNAANAKKKAQAEEHERFCNAAAANLHVDFDRMKYHIQSEDYRRGNPIDNYFRKIEDTVFGAFDHRCVFCGTSHDLTFDHYGISKNEGGNFVLIATDKTMRLNIVVLCRGCNATKAQHGCQAFFNAVQRERASSCQQKLLNTLVDDQQFLKLVKKWGHNM